MGRHSATTTTKEIVLNDGRCTSTFIVKRLVWGEGDTASIEYQVWERGRMMGNHSTITHFDNELGTWGDVSSYFEADLFAHLQPYTLERSLQVRSYIAFRQAVAGEIAKLAFGENVMSDQVTMCPECGKNPAGENDYPCMDCWIDDPFDRLDYEAYRTKKESEHWQALEDQEADTEIQQFIDEYGDYPPDHWAATQNEIVAETVDIPDSAMPDGSTFTKADYIEWLYEELAKRGENPRDEITKLQTELESVKHGSRIQQTAIEQTRRLASNACAEYGGDGAEEAMRELAHLIGYPWA